MKNEGFNAAFYNLVDSFSNSNILRKFSNLRHRKKRRILELQVLAYSFVGERSKIV
jgi:hypothetical protein